MTKLKHELVDWTDLNVSPTELRLDPTLTCGQAFRWKLTGPNEWTCAIAEHVIDLKQTPETVLYRSLGHFGDMDRKNPKVDIEAVLKDYFQLHVSLDQLCNVWSSMDPHFSKLLRTSQIGVRTLRQPVVENLFSFIATSNNNIKRITMLIDKLCVQYGHQIETQKGTFYTFPTIAQMAGAVDSMEATLKELGFGYRAKYYAKTVEILTARNSNPEAFLLSLRDQPFSVARSELMKLSGVGPKVADCVCLSSLDKTDAVPVDTHIWQVAQKLYVDRILSGREMSGIALPPEAKDEIISMARELKSYKTATSKAYELAQRLIVRLFGPYAGWAQVILFSGDLGTQDTSSEGTSKAKKAQPKKRANKNTPTDQANLKPLKRKAQDDVALQTRHSMRLRSKRSD